MGKKLLFLVSVFVVALFTISMAQGPEKTTEPKAATECCPQDCDHSRGYCADCACGDECRKGRVRRLLDVRLCGKLQERMSVGRQTAIAGLPVIAAAEGRPAERTMPWTKVATVRSHFRFGQTKSAFSDGIMPTERFLRPSASAFRARRPSRRSCSRCRPLLRRE